MSDHPRLHAGYNYDDNNGDEVDGAGTNWDIWPVLFDTFEGKTPIILTAEMMGLFDTTCPDYLVPAERDTIVISPEIQTLVIRKRAA